MKLVQINLARGDTGASLPFGKCTVFLTGTTTKAALFNAGGGAIANPLTADSVGNAVFASVNGLYDLAYVSADGTYQNTITQFQIFDLAAVAQALAAGTVAGLVAKVEPTLAALNGDLNATPGQLGLVYADPTASNNDLYVKTGASGAGSWTGPLGILSSQIAAAVASATASANAAAASAAQASGAAAGFIIGSGPPTNSVGVNGQGYFDAFHVVFYGPKTSGSWPTGIPLAGPPGASSGQGANASSRAALAAITGQILYVPVQLSEPGREGMFTWNSANLSALVALDPYQGLYVAPASDTTGASGAWVRKFSGPVNAMWFGAVADDNGTTGTDNGPALLAALAFLSGTASSLNSTNAGSLGLYIPSGAYFSSSTLDLFATIRLFGDGISGASKIRFAAGVTGIRVQRYNTSGAGNVDSPTHRGADGSIVENLTLFGAYSGTEAEAYGVHLRASATVRNVACYLFQGDGFFVQASSGGGVGVEGNANNFILDNCFSQGCRNGLRVNGADANAGQINHFNGYSNRQWGIWDSSFLGNTYLAPHTAANGWDGAAGSIPTTCVYGGNRYSCVPGQEAWCSTNAPTGTTASNQGWTYLYAGGTYNGIVAWVSGTTFRAGGCYYSSGANARQIFLGAYAESDQNPAVNTSPGLFIGGLGVAESIAVGLAASPNGVKATGAIVTSAGSSRSVSSQLGEFGNTTVFSTAHTTYGPYNFKLTWGTTVDGSYDPSNLWFTYYNGSYAIYRVTGPSTTEQFGTGAAKPYYFHAMNFALGAFGNARIMTYGSGVPTTGTHGQGEISFPLAPTAGSAALYRAVATGTPGTWEAIYSGYGVGQIGYSAGAGGAVTQATSRTTGVTLNKLSGQITLVSAAGQTGWQTFTVTNSNVAATDIIDVVQSGGTDLYQLMVTKVQAGSFNISFATTGGTTTEQPVFNFAVTKAVAA